MDADSKKKQKMSSIRERLAPDTRLKIHFEGNSKDKPRFLVAYWSIRGLGAPIRAMLHAAQVDHEVALYDLTEAPGDSGWEMNSYAADKKWLRDEFDPFMNLPFMVDSKREMVLAQTNSIFQYLARELGMVSKDAVEQAKSDEMLCEIMDLRNKMSTFAYGSEGTKDDAQKLLSGAKAHLRKFEAHLAKQYPDYFKNLTVDKESGDKTSAQAKDGIAHLIPGQFSAPDFHLSEMLDQYEGLCKTFGFSLWAEKGDDQTTTVNFQARPDVNPEDRLYPHLEEFRTCFMMLPENVEYFESFLHKEIPCNNCSAKFASCFKEYRQYTRGQEAAWRKKGVLEVQYKKMS